MESIEWILKAPAAIKVIKYSQDKSCNQMKHTYPSHHMKGLLNIG